MKKEEEKIGCDNKNEKKNGPNETPIAPELVK